MKYTTNYTLKKPEGTDKVSIQDFNDNADIIDAKIKENADTIATHTAEDVHKIQLGVPCPNNDANQALTDGIYKFAPDTTNNPFSGGYGIIKVSVSSEVTHNNIDNWIWQETHNTADSRIFVRKKVNNAAWEAWHEIITDAGGTMAGALIAQNTSDGATSQTRNIRIYSDGDTIPTLAVGEIALIREA